MIAHVLSPHAPRGTTIPAMLRRLLGRCPGTVPGQATPERRRLSADASVEYMAMWMRGHGGKDLRPEASRNV